MQYHGNNCDVSVAIFTVDYFQYQPIVTMSLYSAYHIDLW